MALMTFDEIKKLTGNFKRPEWPSERYIKVNYNLARNNTHVHGYPSGWHMEIKNDEWGETVYVEFDHEICCHLDEEDLKSDDWIKM